MPAVNHLCTVSTASHIYKTYALAESLEQGCPFTLHVLVTDSNNDYKFPNCIFYKLTDPENFGSAAQVISKYKNSADKLRWCMKPVFMQFLLNKNVGKIIYLDNDLFFYNDYNFLFNLLNEHSVLLTPHYYKNNPNKEQNWFEANFRVGLYNAGFVGANKNAMKTLQWWAESCLYRCEKNAFRGLFDDQKYLDLIPVMDENAHVLRHKGCNLAGWNQELCPRSSSSGEVLIDGKFPVVFIHFNATTIREILKGGDNLLLSHFGKYFNVLKKYKPELKQNDLLFSVALTHKIKFAVWKIITDAGI